MSSIRPANDEGPGDAPPQPRQSVRTSPDAPIGTPNSPPSQANSPLSQRLQRAIAAWSASLGTQHVTAEQQICDRYARSTGVHIVRPLAVVYPGSTADVQRVVEVSRDFFLPLHPISRGRNWGYGDAAPPTDGQVVVDLSRMNRIIEVNCSLAYAVVEPGVTQRQLYEHLRQHRTGLWMDATGAGLDASLVGNAVDRGFGHTPYGDHFLSACSMQVVLGDGRILNTGFGHYDAARAQYAYRYGVGPYLDGLFAQSNYGIVTRIGLWLMPQPEAFTAFFLFTPDDDAVAGLVERLAQLRRSGLLRSTVHVANDLRALSAGMRYPFDRAGGVTPLPDELRMALRRENGVGAWNASGGLYGTRAAVSAERRELARALRGYTLVFVDDRKIALARKVARWTAATRFGRRLAARLELLKGPYGLLKGIPSDDALRGATWRVRDPDPRRPIDPLEAHAGLIWISPIVPATGQDAEQFMRLIDPIYRRFGFDTLVTFTLITERALCAVTNIAFDRRRADELQRAGECYAALMDTLMAAGFVPYRTSPAGAANLHRGSSVFWDVARQIKGVLDPAGIISPGRYLPES